MHQSLGSLKPQAECPVLQRNAPLPRFSDLELLHVLSHFGVRLPNEASCAIVEQKQVIEAALLVS